MVSSASPSPAQPSPAQLLSELVCTASLYLHGAGGGWWLVAGGHRRRSYRNDETGHGPGHHSQPALHWLLPRILELSRLTSVHRARQYSNTDCSEEEEIMDIEG